MKREFVVADEFGGAIGYGRSWDEAFCDWVEGARWFMGHDKVAPRLAHRQRQMLAAFGTMVIPREEGHPEG